MANKLDRIEKDIQNLGSGVDTTSPVGSVGMTSPSSSPPPAKAVVVNMAVDRPEQT